MVEAGRKQMVFRKLLVTPFANSVNNTPTSSGNLSTNPHVIKNLMTPPPELALTLSNEAEEKESGLIGWFLDKR